MTYAFMFPSAHAHNNDTSPKMSESSLSAWAATVSDDDDLVQKKGATSIVWKWFGYKRSDLQQSTIFC